MFGYVLPLKAELKVREWYDYRAYYCGLCKELAREYGFLSRFLLNYDLVLLALLADGLAGTQGQACAERCIADPLAKKPVCGATPGLALAADALVLTAYYKLVDDVADERFLRRLPSLLLRPFVGRMRRKAAARRPQLDEALCVQTKAQRALEARRCTGADEAADPTAQMTAALFAAAAIPGQSEKALRRMGLFLGRILYCLDAAEDYEKDEKNGAYNVFLLQGLSKAQAAGEAARLCRMSAGEAALCYNLLEFKTNRALLDNILFLGVPQSIGLSGQKRTKPKDRT